MKKYIVATRPSLLAYTQTEQTVNLLRIKNPDCEFEIVKFSTQGDLVRDKPLTSFGGTGVFVKELENAILKGKADFAVHSLKDVPGIQPDDLALVAFPNREDPRDVILTKESVDISQLKENCKIGTGSPRRILQLKLQKPNAVFYDLRGNIDTRINKLLEGQYDAIILAAAGLKRLGKPIPEQSFLPVDICVPAIGQGAISIECRRDDEETIKMVRSVNDENTETAIIAERSYMKRIGGGCKFPLAAYATVSNGIVEMQVLFGDHHTVKIVRLSGNADCKDAEALGIEMAINIQQAAKDQGLIIKNMQ